MLQTLNVEESRELRDFLRESGYNTDSLIHCFGRIENPKVHLLKLWLVGRSLAPSALHTLFQWFWIGAAVETAAARAMIPERSLELLLKSGMVVAENSGFVSTVRISPFNEFLILSDHVIARTGALPVETVLWPNPTSLLCFQLSLSSSVGRTLDLGSGNGIIALTAAGHSGTVIATDLNSRARQFCEFNAALNGIRNLEFREGNAFEPVRGERFDLIVANPPFFVTPTVRRVYSDNGMELDGFCRMLIRQAPEYLAENGYCQMMIEWVQVKGQPWRERIGEWISGLGCDVWVLMSYMQSSLDYTLVRVQEDREELSDPAAQAALVDTWLEYFDRHGVEAIYGGIIMLRRRQGQNWTRMEELPSLPSRPFGEFMRGIFETRTTLGSLPDEELLETRPALPPFARLEKQFVISDDGWRLSALDLQLGEGLPYSLALQPQVADFVGACTGKHTLAELADELAAVMKVDPAVVRRECCTIVRRLADRGMMHVAG
jgi:methylase of polypeptide subunit release factors